MSTVLDSNILVALWDSQHTLNTTARIALDTALEQGGLIVPAPVFTELMALPGRSEEFLDAFFQDTGVSVDWDLRESVWRAAGRAFRTYAARRRRRSGPGPRRILADFLIGAYAAENDYQLLTLDNSLYRSAFPELTVVGV